MPTTITVVCPHCKSRMRAPSEYIGRKGRCPTCKSLVEITAARDEAALGIMPPAAGGRVARAAQKPALSTTDVQSWLPGLIGLAATAVLYLAVFLPLKNSDLGQLFLKRGPIPYVIVLVTCWGLAMLALKYLAVKRQQSYAELELELIPLEVGVQITPNNVDQFLGHLGRVPASQRNSILGRRIQGALEHFKSRHSVPEVQQYLATQAEIDASGVDAGYTLLRAFIWAVPILGFIGTVMGISAAVSNLSETLTAGAEIRVGLGGITTGLATAFDTTLIALAMAIVLLFPTESLRKVEYRMLDRIEAFANEQLLRRMADEREGPDVENMPDVVKHALQSAFQEHQRWLAQWQAQVAELGRIIGSDFEEVLARVQDQISRGEAARIQKMDNTSQLLGEIFDKMLGTTQTWHRAEEDLASRSQQFLEAATRLEPTFEAAMRQLRDEIDRLVERLVALSERLPDGRAPAAAAGSLAGPVMTLEESPATSSDERSRKSRGWFGFRRR